MTNLVQAIRDDPRVGRGTCSIADETYTDAELAEEFAHQHVTTKREAIRYAREYLGCPLCADLALDPRRCRHT